MAVYPPGCHIPDLPPAAVWKLLTVPHGELLGSEMLNNI